jgi:hypothetical protein
LELDAWYAANCSIALDLKILGLTLVQIMRRQNVAPDTSLVEPNLAELRRAPPPDASGAR